jgi:hypothetical protein
VRAAAASPAGGRAGEGGGAGPAAGEASASETTEAMSAGRSSGGAPGRLPPGAGAGAGGGGGGGVAADGAGAGAGGGGGLLDRGGAGEGLPLWEAQVAGPASGAASRCADVQELLERLGLWGTSSRSGAARGTMTRPSRRSSAAGSAITASPPGSGLYFAAALPFGPACSAAVVAVNCRCAIAM